MREVRFSIARRNRVFLIQNYVRIGVRKMLRTGLVRASVWLTVNNLEVEEELSTMVTLSSADGVWMDTWRREQQKAWRKQISSRYRDGSK